MGEVVTMVTDDPQGVAGFASDDPHRLWQVQARLEGVAVLWVEFVLTQAQRDKDQERPELLGVLPVLRHGLNR